MRRTDLIQLGASLNHSRKATTVEHGLAPSAILVLALVILDRVLLV